MTIWNEMTKLLINQRRFLVFVNEVDNDQASEAFDVALSYIKKNPNLGVSVDVIQAQGNRTDSKVFLDSSKELISLQL